MTALEAASISRSPDRSSGLPIRQAMIAFHRRALNPFLKEKAMKTVLAFAFVAAFAISPAAAWDCSSHKVVASTEQTTPVQTAEAPSTTQTK